MNRLPFWTPAARYQPVTSTISGVVTEAATQTRLWAPGPTTVIPSDPRLRYPGAVRTSLLLTGPR